MSENLSPNQKALRRLMKNKPALCGLALIILSVLVAILGYVIAPDSTPNANDQLATIALKNPMFGVKILKLKKNRIIEESGFFNKIMFGSPSPFEYVPINGFEIKNDSVFVEKYAGEDPNSGKILRGRSASIFKISLVGLG